MTRALTAMGWVLFFSILVYALTVKAQMREMPPYPTPLPTPRPVQVKENDIFIMVTPRPHQVAFYYRGKVVARKTEKGRFRFIDRRNFNKGLDKLMGVKHGLQ